MWGMFLGLLFSVSVRADLSDVKILKEVAPFPGSVIYYPNDGKTHPGIIVLHGSEGGSLPYAKMEAQFLAAHGYAVLAFCWYNCRRDTITDPFLPLENIELRNTIKAIEWLKTSAPVGGKAIAVFGVSRGAEQGMVLGSLAEAIKIVDAIAVHAPADVIIGGFNWSTQDKRCWLCSSKDLACFKNSQDSDKWDFANMTWNPACGAKPKDQSQMESWLLDGQALSKGKKIEIEKFKKPVHITVGDNDQVWDYHMSLRLADRLKSYGQPVELSVFAGEGHSFTPAAENKRHGQLLGFLKQNLPN